MKHQRFQETVLVKKEKIWQEIKRLITTSDRILIRMQ